MKNYFGAITFTFCLSLTSFVSADQVSSSRHSASQPNILLILSDDHSVPHLGCYGDKAASTPNLDRFASQGMLFDKHFCVAPQCVPSRAGFVTGARQWRTESRASRRRCQPTCLLCRICCESTAISPESA